ncbi:MAG TPA: SDR family oxidoreductase [Flavitalea sp.]|nr:SDR family oxidoreductase [Flavitalea sp.]
MNTNQKVVVVGATGFLGMEIIRLLLDEGYDVKGLIRETSSKEKVDALKESGVETVVGDMKDPDSLSRAFEVADICISTASCTFSRQDGDNIESVDHQGQLNVVDAAKNAGIKKIVFISFNKIDNDFPLQTAKRAVEKAIADSGMAYTILQPTVFMEVWLSAPLGFDAANATATLYGTGQNPITWISYRDVAAFAVEAADNEISNGRTFELGGPEQLSPLQVISIFEEELGCKFSVNNVPVEALQEQKNSAADPLSRSFAGLMLGYADGNRIQMEETLNILPVSMTSVRDYARSIVPAGEAVH